LLVAFFFFAPVSQPEEEGTLETYQEYFPTLHLFASSADACPFKCVRCTVWDPNAWPNNCVEYYCDTDCENDPGNGGGTQPPSISHDLDCQQTGLNGWCIGALAINLTASDPQGQQVVISGDVNGNNFTCTSNPCTLNLSEGAGLVSYRVDAATGLSASGSAFFYLDATTPQINGNISASPGINGWYNSQAFVTAWASDALSGLASLEVNIDNAGWASYSDTNFTDGMNTIQFRASDNAGNVTETDVQAVNVDTTPPMLSLATTGTTGQNGWYLSAVMLTPTASDELSGLASLEATTDGITWNSVKAPITLSDGTYAVQFRATDQAGNVSLTPLQQVNVDATTPSLSLNISGAKGQNSWYVTHVSVTPNASDAGAGINKIEATVNQGPWTIITSPLSITDGIHSYQIRVTDNAGNVAKTPVLSLMVDTIAPAIAMDDDTLNLGDTLYYDLEDLGSGLWINRTVIEDDDEKYKKVVWLTEAVGQKANGEIRWDGIFADGTRATPGEYFITLKISDRAGNETMRTAVVKVTPLSALIPIPAFTPPSNPPLPLGEDLEEEETQLEFGGTNNGNAGGEASTVISGGQTVVQGKTGWTSESTSFSSGNRSANAPVDASNILWGAAAAAVLGMTLADWQRKREEEEAARRAAERAKEVPDDVRARRRAKVIAKNEAKRAQERAWEQARQAQNKKPEIDEDSFMQKTYKKILSTANVITGMSTWKEKQENQTHQNDVSAARWAGVASVAQEEVKKNASGVGKPLAMPVKNDDSPSDEEKSWFKEKWDNFVISVQIRLGIDKYLEKLQEQAARTPTPTLAPWYFTPSPTITPTPLYTATPQFTNTPHPTSTYLDDQLKTFGIELRNVDSDLLTTIFQATQLTANKFQPLTGGTPQQAFIMSHGTIAIIINKDAQIDNGNCEAERVVKGTQYWTKEQKEPTFNVQTTITCKESPSLANLIHEFVHAFDLNYRVFGNPSQNLFSDNLSNLIVDDEPIRRITIDGNVIRDQRGFITGLKSLENPGTPFKIEEFADTQMNAILDGSGVDSTHGFKNDNYGNARHDEWKDLMKQWQQDMQAHFDTFLK
jgi:hypothetical protein